MNIKGVFIYKEVFDALKLLKSDTKKGRIIMGVADKHIYEIEPNEWLKNDPTFILADSTVANSQAGRKKRVGGESEKEGESLDNSRDSAGDGRGKKSGKSGDKSVCVSKGKAVNTRSNISTTKTKTKTVTKTKTKISKTSSSSDVSAKKKGHDFEEEERRVKRVVVEVPTLDEVEEFVGLIKVKVDPKCFFEYYQAKEWMVAGKKMGDWRACVLEGDRKERRKEMRENKKLEEKEASKKEGYERTYTKEQLDNLFTDFDDIKF